MTTRMNALPVFLEEEEEIPGATRVRRNVILQKDRLRYHHQLSLKSMVLTQYVVVEEEIEEQDESAPLDLLPEEQVPIPPRPRQVQFAEDLVQYEGDPVDSGARGSGDSRRPASHPRFPEHRTATDPSECTKTAAYECFVGENLEWRNIRGRANGRLNMESNQQGSEESGKGRHTMRMTGSSSVKNLPSRSPRKISIDHFLKE
eukprot:3407295-Amphidinium_carterae.2